MRSSALSLVEVAALVLVFAATRFVLHSSGLPYFDPDSYKYLSGADSLLHGNGLPPLYTEVAVNGGALHAVPGYAYFIYALWKLAGVTIAGIAVANSVVALVGYLALAHLLASWISRGAGIAAFLAISLSPSIAWLEHSIMPDAIAAPLLMIAFWLAVVGVPLLGRLRGGAGALASGAVLGFEVLMRTSSQAYVPLTWLLGTGHRGFVRKLGWSVLYACSLVAPLLPWVMANHARHGVFAPAVSTGRNFYFNAVYSGTLDIGAELKRYKMLNAPVAPSSAYALSDRALQSEIAGGLTLVQADRKLGEIAWQAYRNGDPKTLAKQRLAVAYHLFVPGGEAGTQTLAPLRAWRDWYLANNNSSTQIREMLEQRFRYTFSADYTEAAARRTPPVEWARSLYIGWIERLTFDGRALLLAYLLASLVVLLRAELRRELLLTLIAPPAVFIVVFSFVQAPLYRYQVGLHPFMLATIVAACATFFGRSRASASAGAGERRSSAALPERVKVRRRMGW